MGRSRRLSNNEANIFRPVLVLNQASFLLLSIKMTQLQCKVLERGETSTETVQRELFFV